MYSVIRKYAFNHGNIWPLLHKRWLTQQETSTALRPFYFAVHPDLFSQYPKERVVNEESLKILNNHVECLLNNQIHVVSENVKFYIRDNTDHKLTKGSGTRGMRLINIGLDSSDAHTAVVRILRACDLPTDYIDAIKPSHPRKHSANDWSPIPNPEEYKPKPQLHLSTWIRRNIEQARRLHDACTPILDETDRIRKLLCTDLALSDVRWGSNWGLSNYHACLRRFGALVHELRDERWVADLEGHTVVFGNETGVDARGHVILSSDDVPQDWVTLLRSMRRYEELLSQLPSLEAELSMMLNGINVVRLHERVVMADRYARHLQRIIHTIQADLVGRVTGRLGHIELVIDGASGPLTVSPSGQVIIPCSCPGLIARNFIEQKKLLAARTMKDHHRNKCEEEMIASECAHLFQLHSITKEDHVTSEQMRECCLRLMSDVRHVGVSLVGLRLRVSQFYSVMSNGELVIPWDWKGENS